MRSVVFRSCVQHVTPLRVEGDEEEVVHSRIGCQETSPWSILLIEMRMEQQYLEHELEFVVVVVGSRRTACLLQFSMPCGGVVSCVARAA